MSEDFNKYLKRLERFQRQMNKLYNPLMTQSQIWTQQMNMHLGPFNNAMMEQITAVERSFSPIIETLNEQKAFIDQQIAINNHSFDNIQNLHLSMDLLINSQLGNLNNLIPESFYSSLKEITLELENLNYLNEDHQDTSTEITVKEPSVMQEKSMTWIDLIILLLSIWQVIFMYYSDQASSYQREEQISELRIQNELLERLVEATEKQTEAIKEQTNFEQESYEQQRRFEEKFNTFIESLEPYITDQLPVDDD